MGYQKGIFIPLGSPTKPTYALFGSKITDVKTYQRNVFTVSVTHTFSGLPLVSMGSNKAASDDSVEMPTRIPMAASKLYASKVYIRKQQAKFLMPHVRIKASTVAVSIKLT